MYFEVDLILVVYEITSVSNIVTFCGNGSKNIALMKCIGSHIAVSSKFV